MIRSIMILLAIIVVGCHAVSRTEILVERSKDFPQSNQFNADVLEVVSKTAAQFKFRLIDPSELGSVFIDDPIGDNPRLCLQIYPSQLSTRLGISEKWTDRRTSKHRKFVEVLVNTLNNRAMFASVTSHTPDSIRPAWFVAATLCAIAVWLGWWRFRHKPRA